MHWHGVAQRGTKDELAQQQMIAISARLLTSLVARSLKQPWPAEHIPTLRHYHYRSHRWRHVRRRHSVA